eukprot:TRINITY_DN1801_c0_g1_i1.p1 TRINITY_DN1801_c0_g1~~TRINITY_DN1801_c0_g1_i1.p1  ORF type:complete len:622 (+),score=114.43 TRINITY_DN1801_c0_g1_i1:153-1868(+)
MTVNTTTPDVPANTKTGGSGASPMHLTDVTFRSLTWLSAPTQRAIHEVLGFTALTEVQHASLPHAHAGKDVLAKARTGTGKTIAFLLPAVERLLPVVGQLQKQRLISVLVLSPTRELATQISNEAESLVQFHPMNVACVVGGVNIKGDNRRFNSTQPVDILVATPGRLQDHMNSGDIYNRLQSLSVLVLDEADQLLEQGFRPDIERILKMLPTNRQTLLFSATMPPALHQVKQLALKADHVTVDCVRQDEQQTNAQVQQYSMVTSFEEHIYSIASVLAEHIQNERDYKIIVFFTTAHVTGFMSSLFQRLGLKVLEMHSRKTQAVRTKVSDQFRNNTNIIMFSSDVSARGVDYPDVTLCLQVGLTTREQYIHRVGRTGRAGREGCGIVLLCPFETCILNSLHDLPIESIQVPKNNSLHAKLRAVLASVSGDSSLLIPASAAYRAWLGYYNSNLKKVKWSQTKLVQMANEFSSLCGLSEVPSLEMKTVGKMNLKGVPGLTIGPKVGGGGGKGGKRGGGGGHNDELVGGKGKGGGGKGGKKGKNTTSPQHESLHHPYGGRGRVGKGGGGFRGGH